MVTICRECGTEFTGEAARIKSGRKKFCSNPCKNIARSRNMRGKVNPNLNTPASQQKASDSRRLSEKNKGLNHHNWRGGITSSDRLERMRFRSLLQKKIFERDGYTCQTCFRIGGYLQVDHIKEWSKYPELRFDEANCRTLCMPCHYFVTFKKKLPAGTIWGHNLGRRITS